MPIELLNNIGVLHFERGEFEVCLVIRLYDEDTFYVLNKFNC